MHNLQTTLIPTKYNSQDSDISNFIGSDQKVAPYQFVVF